MPRYRSKPVDVDAFVWDGSNTAELRAWARAASDTEPPDFTESAEGLPGRPVLTFHVVKGQSMATIDVGDAVICERDRQGFCPCVASEFVQRYVAIVGDDEI